MKAISLVYVFGLPSALSAAVTSYPTRQIAGVTVIDTPIVQAAQAFARQHADDLLYGHVVRSWVFGAAILSHNKTLQGLVDPEVHAVSALLHDLGFDLSKGIVSSDRRFEVDGAIAARDFIQDQGHGAWDAQRTQLVWDAIALHSQPSIALYKEEAVQVTNKGVVMDFLGPKYGVTQAEWDRVVREIPRKGWVLRFADGIAHMCSGKAATTYDTWMQPFGETLVPGYWAVGHRAIDSNPRLPW